VIYELVLIPIQGKDVLHTGLLVELPINASDDTINEKLGTRGVTWSGLTGFIDGRPVFRLDNTNQST